ncbi:hypothetical protein K502DRAFT_362501 [Neoconidiobolus thromboides FSU 785]|nr:hypothetical protein K502DRAFT_362501 [Neoconidiobolus thromboides FSU 785]
MDKLPKPIQNYDVILPFAVTSNREKRGRACDMCYSRKVKCDKILPNCGNCSKGKIACTYFRAEGQRYHIGRPINSRNKKEGNENEGVGKRMKSIKNGHSITITSKRGELNLPKKQLTLYKVLNPMPKNERFFFQFSNYSLGKSTVILSDNGEGVFFGNSPASYALSSNPHALRTLLILINNPEYESKIDNLFYSSKKIKKFLKMDSILNNHQNINLFSLLSNEMIYQLIESYFYHFNSGYSLLNRKVFDYWMKNKMNSSIQFLFSSVLLTASGYFNIKSYIPRLGLLFAKNSITLLKPIYLKPSLSTIQGLIIMSHYPSTILDDNTAQYGWTYHSLAIKMAINIGLHLPSPHLPSYLQELRRRTMWSLFCNDVLFRLCVGKNQMIALNQLFINMPQLNEILDSSEQWFNPLWPESPSPLRRVKAIEARILFFKIAYKMLAIHLNYKDKFKPFSLANCTLMPLGWNLSKSVLKLPLYNQFLIETKVLEKKLHNWYLSHHPLRQRRVPKAEKNSIIIPHRKDMYAFLGSLHYIYLLVELYRPHFILDLPFHFKDMELFYKAINEPESYPINEFLQLPNCLKPLIASYLGCYYIIERRFDFFHIGVPYKWWWLFNFYLTLHYYLERPYRSNNDNQSNNNKQQQNTQYNQHNNKERKNLIEEIKQDNMDLLLISKIIKIMKGVYKILMEGADRFVLANDIFSVLKMFPISLDPIQFQSKN